MCSAVIKEDHGNGLPGIIRMDVPATKCQSA